MARYRSYYYDSRVWDYKLDVHISTYSRYDKSEKIIRVVLGEMPKYVFLQQKGKKQKFYLYVPNLKRPLHSFRSYADGVKWLRKYSAEWNWYVNG